LICDDPDAPMGNWVHWVLFNLPPDIDELHAEIPPEKNLKLIVELRDTKGRGQTDFLLFL
jgi:phosphatidylethanolamine-binding protein (PEBP) family uncharacterized protein